MRPIATLVLVAAAWATCSAQVPVGKEPYHRVVFEDAHLRVLDVDIPPGATTLEHSHDHDLATVSIGEADTRTRVPGGDWGPVRPRRPPGDAGTTEYAGKQGVHAIQNVGRDPYRLIAVENVKPSGWRTSPASTGSGVAVLAESRAFRASSIRLQAGQSLTRTHASPSVLVLVAGDALVRAAGHQARPLTPSARWAVMPAAAAFSVSPQGGPAHLVDIEVR